MTTITPTRFGLKYAPIPTLALEYEEDLGVLEDESGTRSLYVFKEARDAAAPRVRKKLHVVELPQLTGRSEPQAIVLQLQKENQRFLGPSVVKQQQLQRLLQRLVDRIQGNGKPTASDARADPHSEHDESGAVEKDRSVAEDAGGDGDDEMLGESALDEASASMGVSRVDEESTNSDADLTPAASMSSGPRGTIVSHNESEDEIEAGHSADGGAAVMEPVKQAEASPATEDERTEAEEDEKKMKALKSDSDVSDEDDVESEELEYFSEEGSDEDSF